MSHRWLLSLLCLSLLSLSLVHSARARAELRVNEDRIRVFLDKDPVEIAMKSSGWVMAQYDVLPDRVVVYLWPQAGGVSFDFKFRPRLGMTARTSPSAVSDHYDPESRATVAPVTFRVR